MSTIIWSSATILIALMALTVFWRRSIYTVMEDSVAVTVNRYGFVKRLLPPGQHILHPFERIEFTLTTRTQLASGRAAAVATRDGIPVVIHWSGPYKLQPELVAEARSQRLRSLLKAEKTIARQVDIYLRRLVGQHPMRALFHPATRARLERQLNRLLTDRLSTLGIGWQGLSLQTLELPNEVAEALNKAKAIETLDETIRRLDPATRQVVQGAYQLDELIHWDAYLPALSRLAMKQQATLAR